MHDWINFSFYSEPKLKSQLIPVATHIVKSSTGKMTDPLSLDEVDDELREQFCHLMEAMEDIVAVDPDRGEGAYDALNQRIQQTVTDKPILARIVNGSNQSLLSSAMSCLNLDTSHQAIKLLIESNPSALLVPFDGYTMDQPIYMISRHPEHCVLLPWIASNYAWVLDHERCPPVVLGLLDMYAQRHRTRCTATILKTFLEAYPQAFTLQNPNGDNVLHKILRLHYDYRIECEVNLFKWMAERCPSSTLLRTNSNRCTLLHLACNLLSKKKGNDSSEICKYLIQKCPGSVRMVNSEEVLPIHYLQLASGYRFVREVVVCLLKEYPESYDVPAPVGASVNQRAPSFFPFIQSIKPYFDEEKELKETAASLKESSSSLTKAVTCTKDDLMRSASTVYDSWAISFINSTEDKLQLISTQLQDLCDEGLEPDFIFGI